MNHADSVPTGTDPQRSDAQNELSADEEIQIVIDAIEGTHLNRYEQRALQHNLPRQEAEQYNLGGEELSRDVFDASHGKENLEQVNPEGPAIGVKCTECGEKWVVA